MFQVESVPTPPSNAMVQHTSRSAHVVQEIRDRFFREEWPANKELYAEEDIELIQTSEWFVKRFLLAAYRDSEKAYANLRDTLRWRKEVNLHDVKPTDFPREFYEIGGLFAYECDREGYPVIYMRVRMHRKIRELFEPIQQFLFWNVFRVDQQYHQKGIVILFDCEGVGYSNVDMDMLKSISDVSNKYFPYAVKYIIVYELPWMLNAVRRMAMAIIPSSMVSLLRFVGRNEITDFIPRHNLPDYMGGTCTRDYYEVPEGCKTVEEVAHERGIPTEAIPSILPIFEPFLEEARKAKSLKKPTVKQEPEKTIQTTEAQEQETREQALEDLKETSSAIVYRSGNSYMAFASIYPQNVLKFTKVTMPSEDTNAQSCCSVVILRNNDQTHWLAFKVQSNHPECYTVTPNEGVLLPGVYICIRLRMKLNIDTTGHKFLLLLRPHVQSSEVVSTKTFQSLFTRNIDQVHSHKLYVDSQNVNKNEEEGRSKDKLEQDVNGWQHNYQQLSSRQKWYNFIMLTVLLIAAVVLMAQFMNANHFDTEDKWTQRFAQYLQTHAHPSDHNHNEL